MIATHVPVLVKQVGDRAVLDLADRGQLALEDVQRALLLAGQRRLVEVRSDPHAMDEIRAIAELLLGMMPECE